MKNAKVLNVQDDIIYFDNGVQIYSDHCSDCCEHHWLQISDLKLDDFDGLEFDLSNDSFFKRIPDYGIELIPVNGHSVKIAGYGLNNGYYSSNIDLVLKGKDFERRYDVSECQVISE